MLSNYIHKYYFTEDKEMCWSTKMYTKFRKKHEIKYRNFDEMRLETEEFNLKEKLEVGKYENRNRTIYYTIAIAAFSTLSIVPQILDEKTGIESSELIAMKIIMLYVIYAALVILLIGAGIHTGIRIWKDKRCRLKLEILKREKEHRKKNLG